MRANHRNTVRNQEPRVVYDRDGIRITFLGGEYMLYVYNTYIDTFDRAFDAEMAGHKVISDQLKARAA